MLVLRGILFYLCGGSALAFYMFRDGGLDEVADKCGEEDSQLKYEPMRTAAKIACVTVVVLGWPYLMTKSLWQLCRGRLGR